MRGFFEGAVLAATIATAVQANHAGVSDLPPAPDARVKLYEMNNVAEEPLAIFFLEQGAQIQPMYRPPENQSSGYYYSVITVSCKDLTENFEESVHFIDQELRPTSIRIDREAIRPSILKAAAEARAKCTPGVS